VSRDPGGPAEQNTATACRSLRRKSPGIGTAIDSIAAVLAITRDFNRSASTSASIVTSFRWRAP